MSLPSAQELRDFIDDPLKSKLDANQKIRNKQRRRTRIFAAVYLVVSLPITCAVTAGLGIGADDGFWSTYWGTVALIGGWIALYIILWFRHFKEEMPFEYGPDIAVPLIRYLDPRITGPSGECDTGRLEKSCLFLGAIERCETRAWFRATIGSMDLCFGDVDLRGEDWAFEGLVFVAEFDEDLDDHRVLTAADNADDDFEERYGESVASAIEDVFEVFDGSRGDDEDAPFRALVSGPYVAAFERGTSIIERSGHSRIGDTDHLHRIGERLRALLGVAHALRQSNVGDAASDH